jgi:hypothetical protein
VGIRSLEGELLVEIKFRSVVKRNTWGDKARTTETGSCHPDETGGYGVETLFEILQALKDLFGRAMSRGDRMK